MARSLERESGSDAVAQKSKVGPNCVPQKGPLRDAQPGDPPTALPPDLLFWLQRSALRQRRG